MTDPLHHILTTCLPRAQGERLLTLAGGRDKQRAKFLNSLLHDLNPRPEHARPFDTPSGDSIALDELPLDAPCRAYHPSLAFGQPYPHLRLALDDLAIRDAWLIVLDDASLALHRPEDRWDEQLAMIP